LHALEFNQRLYQLISILFSVFFSSKKKIMTIILKEEEEEKMGIGNDWNVIIQVTDK
jgi:hypothetical protein